MNADGDRNPKKNWKISSDGSRKIVLSPLQDKLLIMEVDREIEYNIEEDFKDNYNDEDFGYESNTLIQRDPDEINNFDWTEESDFTFKDPNRVLKFVLIDFSDMEDIKSERIFKVKINENDDYEMISWSSNDKFVYMIKRVGIFKLPSIIKFEIETGEMIEIYKAQEEMGDGDDDSGNNEDEENEDNHDNDFNLFDHIKSDNENDLERIFFFFPFINQYGQHERKIHSILEDGTEIDCKVQDAENRALGNLLSNSEAKIFAYTVDIYDEPRIFIQNWDDSEPFSSILLSNHFRTSSFSRDGEKIIIADFDKFSIIDLNGTDLNQIPLIEQERCSFPSFSSDGKSIIYSKQEAYKLDIFKINIDGDRVPKKICETHDQLFKPFLVSPIEDKLLKIEPVEDDDSSEIPNINLYSQFGYILNKNKNLNKDNHRTYKIDLVDFSNINGMTSESIGKFTVNGYHSYKFLHWSSNGKYVYMVLMSLSETPIFIVKLDIESKKMVKIYDFPVLGY